MITKAEKQTLLANGYFLRWLFALVEASGLLESTASAGDGRNLYLEGRRSLALDLLRELEAAQPAGSPSGVPVLTLIQILREQAQSAGNKERNVATRDGTYAELGDEGDAP